MLPQHYITLKFIAPSYKKKPNLFPPSCNESIKKKQNFTVLL